MWGVAAGLQSSQVSKAYKVARLIFVSKELLIPWWSWKSSIYTFGIHGYYTDIGRAAVLTPLSCTLDRTGNVEFIFLPLVLVCLGFFLL